MTNLWLALIVGLIVILGLAFIWLMSSVRKISRSLISKDKSGITPYEKAIEKNVEQIFDNDFRQELRNRGRLQFEKIISENAMFLQQDLRLTTTQLNEYLKKEITDKLMSELGKYEQSIADAKQMAVDSIQKTNQAVDQERAALSSQIEKEFAQAKAKLIEQFEANMADIVNHYIVAAIGDQIDLNDQLEFILADLQANKQAIVEDITSGS